MDQQEQYAQNEAELRLSISDAITPHRETSGASALMQLVSGSWATQVVYVAAELGVADLIAARVDCTFELASHTECDPDGMARLLRALIALGVICEADDGRLKLLPPGEFLLSSRHDSLRPWTLNWGRYLWPAWTNLLHSVKTGESGRPTRNAAEEYAAVDSDPERKRIFNSAMAGFSNLTSSALARAFDFSTAQVVVDLGGGTGTLLADLLERHSSLSGVLVELPGTIQDGMHHLVERGLAGRCQFVTGDFLKAVPRDADIYVLKNVLHNWGQEDATCILRNCREAMRHDARLLIVERVLPSSFSASAACQAMACADLNLLVGLGGRARTAAEFQELLLTAGLTQLSVTPLWSNLSILVASVHSPSKR